MPSVEKLQKSDLPPQPATGSIVFDLIKVIRIMRSAGKTIFTQAVLHGQLARVEWEEEKVRLMKMLAFMLLGFACLLCFMIIAGVLALAFSWETAYRTQVIIAVIAVYGTGIGVAWRWLYILSAQSNRAFAATREELAADMALISSKL
jgi:uncharacterized membrane protein YqjE